MTNNWTNIHPNFTEELAQQWQDKGLDYEKAEKWINFSCLEPEDIEIATYSKEKYNNPDDLLNNLTDEVKAKGEIKSALCYFWEDSNKYIVVAGIDKSKDNGKKGAQKKHQGFIDLLVYDGVEEEPYHIEIISDFFY